MENPNPLINIGDLAKPANTLIEKISDAIGGIFKPAQIRRVAEAEAEAEKIRAIAEIEITDLQRRAMARFFAEEAIKQNNIESITRQALPLITEEARADEVDNDWIAHFFDKCRLISDVDMQALWAKVLSGQANSPGTYSKRTIEILSNLERSDALLFSKVCSFAVITIAGHYSPTRYPLIYDIDQSLYRDQAIDFSKLAHLESLGLIHFNTSGTYLLKGMSQMHPFSYFETHLVIEFKNAMDNTLDSGKIIFTQAGHELARVCESQPINGFVDYLTDKWSSFGCKVKPIKEIGISE